MGWRFYRNLLPFSLVFFMHGAHASRDAPQTYDDPDFVNKMIIVAIVFATSAIGHLIQKEEDKLKSIECWCFVHAKF